MNRREFGKISSVAALAAVLQAKNEAHGQKKTKQPSKVHQEHAEAMKKYGHLSEGPQLNIAMLVYPGMFLQDLVGPLTVFESLMNRDIHLVWKNKETVGNTTSEDETLIPVTPSATFAECPDNLDVLFVPGGAPGTLAAMEDKEVLDFLAAKGKSAKYITSVCTGSLILGAAGLLKGYKATSHWIVTDVLREFGAIPVGERVVTDRNRITGGGVTAGIDFGLAIAAKLRSPTYAKAVQLYLEYNPQPPFNSGSPDTAGAEEKKFISDILTPFAKSARDTAVRANRRLS